MNISLKKIITDVNFWGLLGVNIYLVYKYEQIPQIFTTLIWLYYSQNILYGFFHFMEMLTFKNIDVESIKVNENKSKTDAFLASSFAWGFFWFFGFFHFVYFIFLVSMKNSGPFEWEFYGNFLMIFFAFQVLNFIQHKIRNKKIPININQMSFTPMLRVIPMHLCILIPAFLFVTHLTVFLVFKVIADVLMYVITNDQYKNIDNMNTKKNVNSIPTISDL